MAKCPFARFNWLIGLGEDPEPKPKQEFDALAEAKGMQRALKRGEDGGAYREMLCSISRGHSIGQQLRGAMFMAGLMSDRRCYSETAVQFYTVTAAFEQKLAQKATGPGGQRVRTALAGLDLRFSDGYQKDLHSLLGPDWQSKAAQLQSNAACEYVKAINGATSDDGTVLAAAAFILWGPLVIGGGRALERKIKKSYGEGCTHVFEPICKLSKAEHDELKDKFATLMDCMPGDGVSQADLVSQARTFMDCNNELMKSVRMGAKVNYLLMAVAVIVVGLVVFGYTHATAVLRMIEE